MSNRIAISLYQEDDGTVWFGTDSGGINRFNPQHEQLTHYSTTSEDKVPSICTFAPGKLLVTLFGQGAFVSDTQTGSKTPFTVIDKTTTAHLTRHENSVYLYRKTPQTVLLLSDYVYIYHQKNGSNGCDLHSKQYLCPIKSNVQSP